METKKQIIMNELKDQFSVSLQLYYEYNDPKWSQHMDICTFLIDALKKESHSELILQKELMEEVFSICDTNEYSLMVV